MAVCLLLVVERRKCNFKCNIFADTAGEVNTTNTSRLKKSTYTQIQQNTHTHKNHIALVILWFDNICCKYRIHMYQFGDI